jgi:peptidyl-prolyl cis-trans isomerase SurA
MMLPAAAAAQNLFAPVVQVNDGVVTAYELEQRTLFLTLLRSPGDPREEALERLIDERLQLRVARDLGLVLSPEQVIAGEEEFAGRVNLPLEDFIAALAAGGVDEATFRDFVVAGLLWREVVRTKFGPKVQVSDADVDRALSSTAPRTGGVKVLFSEIILPANSAAAQAASSRRAAEISQYTSIDQFSRAARAFSVSPSRAQGGRLDWVDLNNLQPGLAQVLLALAPGQVSQPLPIPNAIALFQLRAIEDGAAPPLDNLTVDYAVYSIPGGRSPAALAEAAKIEAKVATCNELYPLARGGPPERLQRETLPIAEVPADIALELAKLDDGEFSTALTRGGALALVMLCSRSITLPETVTRENVRNQLQTQRLTAFAEGYLAELRAEEIFRYP